MMIVTKKTHPSLKLNTKNQFRVELNNTSFQDQDRNECASQDDQCQV